MHRTITSFAALCACFTLSACGGGGAVSQPPSQPTPSGARSPIKHVIIIFQENRTVDDLFNGLPGADTVTTGQTSSGKTVPLQPIPLEAHYDLDHSHAGVNGVPGGFVIEYNGGKMNGFDKEPVYPEVGSSPPPLPAYGFVPQSETKPYFQLAEQFTFADHMFQTNEGPSFPAHQFIISGTSEPSAGSDMLAAENVIYPPGVLKQNSGCDSPAGSTVALINSSTGAETQNVFPCFDHETLLDLLDGHGVSWRYYTPEPFFLWTGPEAIKHIRFGADWSKVSVPETNIFDDVALGTLPAVSWVIPTSTNSDHATSNSKAGPSWVGDVVNVIGTSRYWNDTAIFVTWDDWGGWYDHVPPTVFNSYELGFRVPLIVISPFAKPGYVSKVPHEFGSLLRFIEDNWSLGSLGTTDQRADDLADCFNYSQTPLAYKPVSTLFTKEQLIHARRSEPPDND